MATIHPPTHVHRRHRRQEGWDYCHYCGLKKKYVDVKFNTGSVEPTDDELFTGASSEDTGKYLADSLVLLSGTWAGGDAAGWITLYSATGIDFDTQTWGEDEEVASGASGGTLTLDGAGDVKKYGPLYPESLLTERDGVKMCIPHYHWKYDPEDRDEASRELDVDEEDRGEEW